MMIMVFSVPFIGKSYFRHLNLACAFFIYKANLRNTFVSPYPTLFLRCGSVGRNIILFLSSPV